MHSGDNFGWPYCYGDRQLDRQIANPDPTFCARTTEPTLQLPAYVAPLDATFADSPQLPAGMRGSLRVTVHGSMYRSVPEGCATVRVAMDGVEPVGVTDFATGWLTAAGFWGRPGDIVEGPDGAFSVSDDAAGAIYRIWYTGML